MRFATFAPLVALLALLAGAAGAQQLRLSTENDILMDNPTRDDLYTFAVALEAEHRGLTFSLRENAFTDRAAGIRFDETYLSVARALPVPGPWTLAAEAGVVHRGHGLFGESAQNTVHRTIGEEEVDLEYLGSGLHPRIALAADRRFLAAGRFDWGPRLELDLAPGLRSWALVGAEATWQPREWLAVELFAGGRFADASYRPLERHLVGSAPAARVGLVVDGRYFASWSYNDYGDEREHLSVGVRLPLGRRADGARRW